jgi:hypothetical protein
MASATTSVITTERKGVTGEAMAADRPPKSVRS